MSSHVFGVSAVLACLVVSGCGVLTSRTESPKGQARIDRGKSLDKQVAQGTGGLREATLADPSTMIPPPPNMDLQDVPPIPESPGPERYVSTAGDREGNSPASGIVSPTGKVRSPVERARAVAEQAPPVESNLQALQRLRDRAADRFKNLEGFECKLTRRETIGSKAMPEEVLQYKIRKSPYSLHIKWIGKEAQGRELVYVDGKYEGKVQILTGREPELFRPSGIKVARLPTDKDVASKSRFDIREGGMKLSIEWFGRVVEQMESDPAQANRLRYLGPKSRLERASGLEAVEETIPPNWEPLLPKGGKRTTYFDCDLDSPSYGLPILIVTIGDAGREVEYYFFDQLRPIRPSDADFDIQKLWK